MVSVDQSLPPRRRQVARAHRSVEPLHNHVLLRARDRAAADRDRAAPRADVLLRRPGRADGRRRPRRRDGDLLQLLAEPGGPAHPAGVDAGLPRAGRRRPARRGRGPRFTRLLGGPEAADRPEIAELAGLLREACSVLSPGGAAALRRARRPALAGRAAAGSCGTAATLLREYRGDGHLTALLRADLSGLEALITHTATGRGFLPEVAKAGRGYSRGGVGGRLRGAGRPRAARRRRADRGGAGAARSGSRRRPTSCPPTRGCSSARSGPRGSSSWAGASRPAGRQRRVPARHVHRPVTRCSAPPSGEGLDTAVSPWTTACQRSACGHTAREEGRAMRTEPPSPSPEVLPA